MPIKWEGKGTKIQEETGLTTLACLDSYDGPSADLAVPGPDKKNSPVEGNSISRRVIYNLKFRRLCKPIEVR